MHYAIAFYSHLEGEGCGWELNHTVTIRKDDRLRDPHRENNFAFIPLNGGRWNSQGLASRPV